MIYLFNCVKDYIYSNLNYKISCTFARVPPFSVRPYPSKKIISFSLYVPCASFPLSPFLPYSHSIAGLRVISRVFHIFPLHSFPENVREKQSKCICLAHRSKLNKHSWIMTLICHARTIEIKSAKCGYSDLSVISATTASIRAWSEDLLFFDFISPSTATRTILTGVISLTSPVHRGANSESSG